MVCSNNSSGFYATNLPAGNYSLVVQDKNGCEKSFEFEVKDLSVGISPIVNAQFKVYPNPIINKLNVTGIEFVNSIAISNSLGQIIEKINGGKLNQTIDLTYLQSGIYYVLIESPLGSKKVKIIKMQKIIITLSLFVASVLSAQNFQGMAVYESKTSTSDMASNFRGNREITPEMQKTIEERMKAMFEKTFVLTFDRNASIYAEEEKIESPGQQGGFRFMSSMMGGGGTHYKNVKDKLFLVDKEFAGKEFLIQDSLPKY